MGAAPAPHPAPAQARGAGRVGGRGGARGPGASVIAVLRQALLEEPLAEPLHERLISVLYANGQVAEALRQYERVRRTIADELGADPGSGLRELHQRMLQGCAPNTSGGRRSAARAPHAPRGPAPPRCARPPGGPGPRWRSARPRGWRSPRPAPTCCRWTSPTSAAATRRSSGCVRWSPRPRPVCRRRW
ncbi:hypothetical protein GXW82_17690 [Streptacidiphilus sp. 4-A2]|nr:hypothetical protein [Streptacidiphilus sp. 4-A2]